MAFFGIVALILCCFAGQSKAQTVQLMPTPRQTFLSNTGGIIPGAALYIYNGGTTTAASTYTDFTGTVLNANPVIADAFGRFPQIWLLNQQYKFIMCVQNDGTSCASGDTLWTVDGVPGFGAGGTGSSASPFISASPNPATTGILRLASGDSSCWRNVANNANICFSHNSSDDLVWAGAILLMTEGGPGSTCPAGFDGPAASSSLHRMTQCINGASDVVSGAATIDTFTNKTYDTGGSGNVFKIAGTQVNAVTGTGNTAVLSASPSITGTVGGSATYSTPTDLHPTINTGIVNNGTGFQHIRFTGCTDGSSAGWCVGTGSWNASWADTNYTVTCTPYWLFGISEVTSGGGVSIQTRSTGSFTYQLNATGGGVHWTSGPEIDCIGVHD